MSRQQSIQTLSEGRTLDESQYQTLKGYGEKEKNEEDPKINREEAQEQDFLQGWRLLAVTVAIMLGFFISALDLTIVSTSIVPITNALGSFQDGDWIVTSYLLTYTSFLIIWAKLSDIFGRKHFMILAVAVYIIFSAACAAAQTITQLIILRSFQGIGGAGIFSTGSVIIPELVPRPKYGAYNSLAAVTIGISFLLGPIIGGAINSGTLWRWIFIINVPIGIFSIFLLVVALPSTFPLINVTSRSRDISARKVFRELDLIGFLSLLTASVLFVCSIEEAGTRYAWSSAFTIVLLVLSGICFLVFLAWQYYVNPRSSEPQPVLPWRLLKNRLTLGVFLTSLMAGVPFTVIIIELPQRFQAVNQASPLNAGIRLLAFSLAHPFLSATVGPLASKAKVPPFYLVIFGSLLQIAGLALLYHFPPGIHVNASTYGFQVLIGAGTGFALTPLLLVVPYLVAPEDLAVTMGAVSQCRLLGGAIGVAVATNVANNYISRQLAGMLAPEALGQVLTSVQFIDTLPQELQVTIREYISRGYDRQIVAMLGFACVEFLVAFLMFQRKPQKVL